MLHCGTLFKMRLMKCSCPTVINILVSKPFQVEHSKTNGQSVDSKTKNREKYTKVLHYFSTYLISDTFVIESFSMVRACRVLRLRFVLFQPIVESRQLFLLATRNKSHLKHATSMKSRSYSRTSFFNFSSKNGETQSVAPDVHTVLCLWPSKIIRKLWNRKQISLKKDLIDLLIRHYWVLWLSPLVKYGDEFRFIVDCRHCYGWLFCEVLEKDIQGLALLSSWMKSTTNRVQLRNSAVLTFQAWGYNS